MPSPVLGIQDVFVHKIFTDPDFCGSYILVAEDRKIKLNILYESNIYSICESGMYYEIREK